MVSSKEPMLCGKPRFSGVEYVGGCVDTVYLVYAQDEFHKVGKLSEIRTKVVRKRLAVDEMTTEDGRETYRQMANILANAQAYFRRLGDKKGG